MDKKKTLIMLYGGVAVLCILILGMSFFLSTNKKSPIAQPTPEEVPGRILSVISEGLEVENQLGEQLNLKDLDGKVWLFCQFFVDCPQCAQRNFTDLLEIAKTYKDEKDFRIICLSVNPEEDTVEKLAEYSDMAKADPKFWWFVRADKEAGSAWVRSQLYFHDVKERTDVGEINSKGRYAHDMGIALIDREGQMRGKYDLYSSKFQNEKLYNKWKEEMAHKIRLYLDAK